MFFKPLELSKLKTFFDQEAMSVLKYLSNKAFFSQPELLPDQDPLPLHIPKEHIEQWVIQAIGGKPVGAGSYPVDVIYDNEGIVYGIDIVMVSASMNKNGAFTGSKSGETSLSQSFQPINGDDLDTLFLNKDYESIKDHWIHLLENKYKKTKKDFNTDETLIFFIIRGGVNLHLCGVELNLNSQSSPKVIRGTNSSVFISGLIDKDLGCCKVYKAKKRLELRLYPSAWESNNYLLNINDNFNPPIANLKELAKEGQLKDYTKKYLEELDLL